LPSTFVYGKIKAMDNKIIGNQKLRDFLFSADLKKRLGHAYLFVGPCGIGKSTLAKAWIKFILCEKGNDKSCGQCPACQQIGRGTYSDFVEVGRLEGKKNISIEQIRELQAHLSLSAMSDNYKIALIKEVENLNEEAFNAFLKTLEEPTGKTILILTANSTASIPLTILSRCAILKMNLAGRDELREFVNMTSPQPLSEGEGNKIVMWANGRPGLAKRLIDEPELYQWYDDQTKTCLKILQAKKVSARWKLIDEWFKHLPKSFNEKTDVVLSSLNVYQTVIRQILRKKFDDVNRDPLYMFAQGFSVGELSDYLVSIESAKIMIKKNINQQLVLENLFI
jgi:energy-coupling factor transporter ATP-binding protein EcfA2